MIRRPAILYYASCAKDTDKELQQAIIFLLRKDYDCEVIFCSYSSSGTNRMARAQRLYRHGWLVYVIIEEYLYRCPDTIAKLRALFSPDLPFAILPKYNPYMDAEEKRLKAEAEETLYQDPLLHLELGAPPLELFRLIQERLDGFTPSVKENFFGVQSEQDELALLEQLKFIHTQESPDALYSADDNTRIVSQALRLRSTPALCFRAAFEDVLNRSDKPFAHADKLVYNRELARIRAMPVSELRSLVILRRLKASAYGNISHRGCTFALDLETMILQVNCQMGDHRCVRQMLFDQVKEIVSLQEHLRANIPDIYYMDAKERKALEKRIERRMDTIHRRVITGFVYDEVGDFTVPVLILNPSVKQRPHWPDYQKAADFFISRRRFLPVNARGELNLSFF